MPTVKLATPRMPKVVATTIAAPPAWALMERNLIALMEESGRLFARKYFERGGGTLLAIAIQRNYGVHENRLPL